MDSLEWSKTFPVLTISRFYLHHALGFSLDMVRSLTDEEMEHIADLLIAQYFDAEFDEAVRFVVACEIVEKHVTEGEEA